ncbi:hypothetical protein ASPFODRAFT_145376 [Aspergillus luchuensis CBS 106.47]|uniref:Uncharacterized protein n=1 Tax=Aspergillus luchuensis (strain CBS 106.47) TaxID=1137211 RepID=A0A1M3T4H9_ASPLC|nr:hypothetical protein ASPFODRAFT_145376 [Aspergillus luchuensis CBS 106.47]GAA89216.1 hypothetical protein AKAW_07330 [Aspergillus luchuensis IFO 4308]
MPTLPKLLSALPRRCTLSAAAAIISVSHIPTMFGTLVSTGLDRETLEFIENPDPVAAAVSFLERLSSKSSSREDRLDLLLADLRNSIETLAVFISGDRCATRVEQSMLLAMAARQIGVICGRMANCCKAMHQGSLSDTSSSQRGSEPVPCPIPVEVSVSHVSRQPT